MDRELSGRIITLRDLWGILMDHIWIVLLAAILVMCGAQAVNRTIVQPTYRSKATLYILRQDNEPNYIYTQSDFSLAKDVVNDCNYVLKSQEVLDEVIRTLKLDCTARELQSRISTNNPENTRFLEVYVQSDSPKEAKRIVDKVCDIAADRIADSMGFDQVNLYAYGTLPDHRSNGMGLLKTGFLGGITAICVYAAYLVGFLLDTSVKTEQDIEKYLGISTLAEIPNSQTGKRSNSGKYRYQYSKRYQYQSSNAHSERGGRNSK